MLGLFAVIYISLNFWVNLTDFLYTGLFKEFYHDEFFLTSFSYKVHQIALSSILAFLTGELMSPKHTAECPSSLTHIFTASIFVSISLMLSFIQELTWYTAGKRIKVFKTEITKVLMTVVYFNFFTLLLMSWMWQLNKQIKQLQKNKEASVREQRRAYEE